MDRLTFLASTLLALAVPGGDPIAAIESRFGGTIGVAAYDVGGRLRLSHRADERFPMASTWKLALVTAVLARVDAGRDRLDRNVRFTTADLEPPYSPIAQQFPHGGALPLGEICRYTIQDSDNTGADLLATHAASPGAVTSYIHGIGIRDFRADRLERDLPNSASRAERRDTATPAAMASLAGRLAGDSPLSRRSTAMLLGWMRGTRTGDDRLRAGVPKDWHVADKTGTYHNAANDVGILYPPSGSPIAIAVYTIDVPGRGDRAIAACARLAAAAPR